MLPLFLQSFSQILELFQQSGILLAFHFITIQIKQNIEILSFITNDCNSQFFWDIFFKTRFLHIDINNCCDVTRIYIYISILLLEHFSFKWLLYVNITTLLNNNRHPLPLRVNFWSWHLYLCSKWLPIQNGVNRSTNDYIPRRLLA